MNPRRLDNNAEVQLAVKTALANMTGPAGLLGTGKW